MNTLKKISDFIGKYMAVIVLAVTILSLFLPKSTIWIDTGWIDYLLMIVMFGMGLTLKFDDFRIVFTRPKDILIGCISQFTIMSLLAFGLSKIFGLEAGLFAGIVLVGTCPGGTSSNVITYLSKGDVALSVGMTSINTLLAPLLTPAITYLFLHTSIKVDVVVMFMSMIKIVLVPIILGLVINRLFGKYTEKAITVLPMISIFAITMIVGSVVSHTAENILNTGLIIFVVVILHNVLGYLCGYLLGKALKMPLTKKKALSIEIGMQNSGLATSLAKNAFSALPMAAVPGAIFSVWHNISGAILANFFRRMKEKDNVSSDN